MTWAITAIALLGVVLNVRGKWQGFCLWLISNAYWCGHNIQLSEYAQAALFGVFWMLSLYGIYQWRKRPSVTQVGSKPWLTNRLRAYGITIDFLTAELQTLKQQQTGIYNIDGSKAKTTKQFFEAIRRGKKAESI